MRTFHHFTVCTLIALLASQASAADQRIATPNGFSAEIKGSQSFTYDSNPLRVVNDADPIYGSITAPRLVLRNTTPTSMVESDTRIAAGFFDQSEFNSVDLNQKLLLRKQNERWTAGVRAFLDHETTRTSELTNYSLHLPKVERTRIGAAPQIIFRADKRNAWTLDATATDVSYNNNAYTDYHTYSVSPGYQHKFDPDNTLTVTLGAQRYETTNSALTSDSVGPTVGWTSILTPLLTLRATAGVQSTHKSGVNAGSEEDSFNYVFSAGIAFNGTVDTFDFSASRAREPFGNGTETLLTSISVKERHAINRSVALDGSLKYQFADYSTEPGVNLDHGLNASAGIVYMLSNDFDIRADYTFRQEWLTHTNGTVDQHIGMLGFVYHPSWSRN